MIHCIRLNAAGAGFTAFLAQGERVTTFPLGSVPPGLSQPAQESVGEVQARIDEFVAARQEWSVAFSCRTHDGTTAVGYGGRVEAPDDKGRMGIRFVHVALVPAAHLVECTRAVLEALSPAMIGELAGAVAAAALGTQPPESVVRMAQRRLESARHDTAARAAAPVTSANLLYQVVQDTAGAGPFTWMLLAAQQAGRPGPWQVHDIVQDDGRVATVVSPGDGRRVAASELLVQAAERRVVPPVAVVAADPPQGEPLRPTPHTPKRNGDGRPPPVELSEPPVSKYPDGLLQHALLLVASNMVALVAMAIVTAFAFGVGSSSAALLFVGLGLAALAALVFAPALDHVPGARALRPPRTVSAPRRAGGYFALALLAALCVGGWAATVRANLTGGSGFAPGAFREQRQSDASLGPLAVVDAGETDEHRYARLADALADVAVGRDAMQDSVSVLLDSLARVSAARDSASARIATAVTAARVAADSLAASDGRVMALRAQVRQREAERDDAVAEVRRLRSRAATTPGGRRP